MPQNNKSKIQNSFWNDWDYAFENYSELIKKYPNKWVALFNKKVIAFGSDLKKVKETSKAKVGNKKIPFIHVESGGNVY